MAEIGKYLHGIETVVMDSEGRAITVPSTSVIGIVGTMDGEGVEEKFPLNKPVLVTKLQDIAGFGSGTIPSSIRGIYNQANAICVVVRIAEALDSEGNPNQTETIKNAAGDEVSYTGIYAFLRAYEEVKVKPKILIVPYLSSINESDNKPNSIVTNLEIVAKKLRSIYVVDGPNSTMQDAITFASNIGSSRCYILDPSYKPSFEYIPATLSSSSLVAGVIAKNDVDPQKGFWWSPSNTILNGVVGINRPVSFGISDKTSEANLLNAAGVGTIVFAEGQYRIWGSRSPSQDPNMWFIPTQRIIDAFCDSVDSNMLWVIDRPFNLAIIDTIQENLKEFLKNLTVKGAILGGKTWIDREKNNATTYANGELTVSLDLEPVGVMEHLIVEIYRNKEYIEILFK